MSNRFVLVTPLRPPFEGLAMFFKFDTGPKTLAVSHRDGQRIVALLNNAPLGRTITLSAAGDKIKVEVVLQ